MKVLETERLTLRWLSAEDASFILDLLNQPAFLQYVGDRGVRTLEDARAYIARGPIASYEQHGFGLYLVELKADQAPLGICGLLRRDGLSDVEIGFAFLPQFWSKGYAHEAAVAVMTYSREVLKLNRIVAIVAPDNDPSIRLLNKLGLQFERMINWPEDGAKIMLFGICYVENREA